MMDWRIAVLLVPGMLPWAGVNAQHNTTFRVSATVEELCDVTAPDVAAGDYTARRGGSLRATLRLRATCSPDTTYIVGQHKGTWPDMGRQTGVGTGLAEDHTLDHTDFGGVPATPVVPLSGYADAITVRIYY